MTAKGALGSPCLVLALALALALTACGGSDDASKAPGAAGPAAGAKAPAAAKPQPAAGPRAPVPPATDEQIEFFASQFTWDPSKGEARDLQADARACSESQESNALVQVKKGIDCMIAKGWSYQAR